MRGHLLGLQCGVGEHTVLVLGVGAPMLERSVSHGRITFAGKYLFVAGKHLIRYRFKNVR